MAFPRIFPLYAKNVRARLHQFADFSDTFFVVAAGLGIDFTGCTARLALRVVPTDPVPLIAISTTPNAEGSIVLGTPTNALGLGGVQINVTKLATGGIDVPIAHGDLLVTWTDGTTSEILSVDFEIAFGSTY